MYVDSGNMQVYYIDVSVFSQVSIIFCKTYHGTTFKQSKTVLASHTCRTESAINYSKEVNLLVVIPIRWYVVLSLCLIKQQLLSCTLCIKSTNQ